MMSSSRLFLSSPILPLLLLLSLNTLITACHALDNGLGLTPPLGWNSWNKFGCDINETIIRSAADRIVELGLQDLGYSYINIDDCWMASTRDENGRYQADPRKFPSGMRSLGDYIHSLDLKFGIYTSAGTKTCQGLPGSLHHEEVDASTFASWGVDFLKYDNCYNENIPSIDRYTFMRDALNATGRPTFYSLCQWGVEESWRWASRVGNAYRSTQDINPSWSSIKNNFWKSQQHIATSQPGGWADPDMLEVGNGHLLLEEERSHFSLWCLAKAPLILGMDLSNISNTTLDIISNKHLIGVNQDVKTKPATCFVGCNDDNASYSVFATVISNGDTIMLVINWNDTPLSNSTYNVAGQDVGVVPTLSQSVAVTNLWTYRQVGRFDFDTLKSLPIPSLEPHACVVYRLSIVRNTTVLHLQQHSSLSINNGLARVPPMGWNSWNAFHCDISEKVVRDVVRVLSSTGLQELGYQYVNIDDCWMANNRTNGGIYQANATKFPSGMKLLGDYVHAHDLRYGLYTSAGTKTCQGLPGSLEMEYNDATTFAEWGVDFLKYDNCYNEGIPSIDRYTKMRDALNATGRPIFYSICQWGDEDSWRWAPSVGNSWRSTRDISPHWESIKTNFLKNQRQVHRSQPGSWADPDMMEIGNGNLTLAEQQTHFALWCLTKASLWLGMDLVKMSDDVYKIVSNKNFISVNQDPNALPATCYVGCNDKSKWSVYATRLTGDDTVAIIVNWQDTTLEDISLGAYQFGIVPTRKEEVTMMDLWTNQVVGTFGFEELKTLPIPAIPAHGSVVYQFSTLGMPQSDDEEDGDKGITASVAQQ